MAALADIFSTPLVSGSRRGDAPLPSPVQDQYGRPLDLTLYAHAPKGGVTIKSKFFKGGEFIPAEVLVDASPEERAAVESGESRGKPLPPEGGVKEPKQSEGNLGGGYSLVDKSNPRFPEYPNYEFVGPQGEKVGVFSLADYGPPIGMTIQDVKLYEQSARGQGLGRKSLLSLVDKYGQISSDPQGNTTPDAVRMWESLGAKKVPTNKNSKGFFYTLKKQAVESGESRGKPLPPEGGVREPKPQVGFDRWFEGSKVVDAAGNPRTVFHGSPNAVEEFDPSKQKGIGIWFAENQGAAKKYAGPTGHIKKVHLRITNPVPRDAYIAAFEKFRSLPEGPERESKVVDYLKSLGYDGMKSRVPGSETWMVFDPSQIREVR